MNNLTTREKVLLFTAGMFLVAYLYITFFLNPIILEYNTFKIQYEVNKEKLDNFKNVVDNKENSIKALENFKDELNKMEEKIPSSKQIPELIVFFEKSTQESQIFLEDITFDNNRNPQKNVENNEVKNQEKLELEQIPILLNLTGSYEVIIDFLKKIESSERLLKITDMQFNKNKNMEEILNINLSISAFSLKNTNENRKDNLDYDFMNDQFGKDNPFK